MDNTNQLCRDVDELLRLLSTVANLDKYIDAALLILADLEAEQTEQ